MHADGFEAGFFRKFFKFGLTDSLFFTWDTAAFDRWFALPEVSISNEITVRFFPSAAHFPLTRSREGHGHRPVRKRRGDWNEQKSRHGSDGDCQPEKARALAT
ncbi:MAG TPA: hypothetical protein VFI09_09495 [Solirubrobacterales bacterium]|nr:hypothetical protein [Solirubrobacterales bacterium]